MTIKRRSRRTRKIRKIRKIKGKNNNNSLTHVVSLWSGKGGGDGLGQGEPYGTAVFTDLLAQRALEGGQHVPRAVLDGDLRTQRDGSTLSDPPACHLFRRCNGGVEKGPKLLHRP